MTITEGIEFLRRSLLDLDDELRAGDISPQDYVRLRDEYTVRLARALREDAEAGGGADAERAERATEIDGGEAADAGEAAGAGDVPGEAADAGDVPGEAAGAGEVPGDATPPPAAAPPPRRRQKQYRVVGVALAVLVFAVGAGVLVARTSGTRTAGQSLTGDIRQTIRDRLDHCLQLSGGGQLLEAVKCYDGVISDQPSSAEAYTYRAWTLVRTSDARLWPTAQQNLDQAVALDPSYPDARVFRAVLYREQGRLADARADLAAFDALNPPQMMRDLVDQMGLRASLDPSASTTTAPTTSSAPTTSTSR